MDICPDCAFCSLKREQCQDIKALNRVHCNPGGFSPYINPQISAQHGGEEGKVPSCVSCCSLGRSLHWELGKGRKKQGSLYPTPLQSRSSQSLEDDNVDFLRGMRLEYWCSRMAIYGCKDPAVTLWLKAEYDGFQDGDDPKKVGDRPWMFPSLPSPLLSLTFIPMSPDLRLERSSASQLLHVQELPVPPQEHLQPDGEKQPRCLLHSPLFHDWRLHSQLQVPAGFTGPLLFLLGG